MKFWTRSNQRSGEKRRVWLYRSVLQSTTIAFQQWLCLARQLRNAAKNCL